MSVVDQCLERIAHLDQADHLLNNMRVYNTHLPVREALEQHRALLCEARRHIESARALVGDA